MNSVPQRITIAMLATVIGCTDPDEKKTAGNPAAGAEANSSVLEEDDVLAIAKRQLESKDKWADRATFEIERTGNEWQVYVQRRPIVPGGHRLITIDNDGNVTSYIRGR